MVVIPRRLVFRVLSQVLHGQARAIAGRTAQRSGERRGLEAREHAAEKGAKRSNKADDLRIQAAELSRRVGDPSYYQGPGLEPALLGWLSVLAMASRTALPSWTLRLRPIGL
jgi:hypothetical protein